MDSFILLENIEIYARHGVFAQENTVGNVFIINLKIGKNLSKASVSDNIDDTLNYASVFEIVKQEMSVPSCLIEHVAGRIIRKLREFSSDITTIEIKISKRNPPVGGQVEYASVILID